jgi:hypothetical protein
MFTIDFQLSSFDDPLLGHAANQRVIDALLRVLVLADVEWLRRHPEAPHLYESGIRYVQEPAARELFADIPTVLARGFGDCDDLATWRAAELRVRFRQPADVFTTLEIDSGGNPLYHVLVRSPLGVEDPSSMLGMNWSKQ